MILGESMIALTGDMDCEVRISLPRCGAVCLSLMIMHFGCCTELAKGTLMSEHIPM